MDNKRNKDKKLDNKKYTDSFDEMIKTGEAFKKALGLSDNDIYKLLKRKNS